MYKWLILPNHMKRGNNLKILIKSKYYQFYSNIDRQSYYLENDKGLFIFGYILPVLGNSDQNVTPKNLLTKYEKSGKCFIRDYKGIFTLVIYYKGRFEFFTDRFGVSKFFYSGKNNMFIASNDLKLLSEFHKKQISKINILEYFVFNYFVNGHTLYKEIRYTLGGINYTLNSKLEKRSYFKITNFLEDRDIKYQTKKDTYKKAAEIWDSIINQYLKFFSDKKISLTLTSGLDSRMILAALKKNNYLPFTFTFGHKDSMDVIGAKNLAKEINLEHTNLYPDKDFFTNYSNKVLDTLIKGNSLTTLYRAHRLDAYSKIKDKTQAIFFGFIGSEIIRGLYPDGLLIPKLVSELWLNEKLDVKQLIIDHLSRYCMDVSPEDITRLIKRISKYRFIKFADQYLFKVIIPLHFAQDIMLLEDMNISSLCPYWDIDFLNYIKNTQFFISNSRQKDFAKLGHFKRRKQPMFSSNIITLIDKNCALASLGKGYSPKDYANHQYYSYFKFLMFKLSQKIKGPYAPNFSYGDWFFDFLKVGIEKNDLGFLNLDSKNILKKINEINRPSDEYSLLPFTQLLNIDLLGKYL